MKNNIKDSLEDFIRNNAEEFDDKKAPNHLWKKIDSRLIKIKKLKNRSFAIGGLIVIISILAALFLYSSLTKSTSDIYPVQLDFARVTDFEETQYYYTTLINDYSLQLSAMNPEATILTDLSLLDNTDQELRKELALANGEYKIYVINALIQNYQTKLNLLIQLLEQIENAKNNKYEIH